MQFSTLALVASLAVANAQTIEIPSCGTPCFSKANLSCDPTQLSCVCPELTRLMSDQELITCILGAGCTADQLTQFTGGLTKSCAGFSAGGAASSASSAVSSAAGGLSSAASSAGGAASSVASSISGVISTAIPTTPVVAPTPRPSTTLMPTGASNGTNVNGTRPGPTSTVQPGAGSHAVPALAGLGLLAVLAL